VRAGLVKICRKEVDATPELGHAVRCNSLSNCVVEIGGWPYRITFCSPKSL